MEKLDLIYSLIVLKGLLPRDHFGCWLLFVRACHLPTFLKVEDVQSALVQFAKCVEQLYGKESFTPNLHLHMHLLSGLWSTSFERYNSILGSYHMNKR